MITNEKILMYAKSYLEEGLKGIEITIEKNGGKAEASLKRLRTDIQVEITCIEEMMKNETAKKENNMQWRPITILKKEKNSTYIKEEASELPHPLENVLLTDGKHIWIENLFNGLKNKGIEYTAWMPLPTPYKEVKRGKKMKRSELENYLGKHVEITLFDDFVYRGILRKTEEKIERYVKRNYYFCEGEQDNTIFRCSHVKRLKQL